MQNAVDIEVIRALLPLAADKDARWYMNGVYVEFQATRTVYVATNGHMLGIYTDDTVTNEDVHNVIIPRDVVKALKPKHALRMGTLHVNPDTREARILNPANGQDFGFNPIEGQYPDYQRLIPAETSGVAANYNAEHLYAFAQVNKMLGASTPGHIVLHQNGDKSASVKLCRDQFTGVIMSIRIRNA